MKKVKVPEYPFVPRSNTLLCAGQFFSFHLTNGRYACGRILEKGWPRTPGSRTLFRVGLMDWSGDDPAAANDLAGRRVLDQGYAHIGIVPLYEAQIDGFRPLEADGIAPDPTEEGVYGAEVLRILAHKHFWTVPLSEVWLTPTAVAIATAIHADSAFDRLPILADALEEAGCTNADLLLHCRQPGEHVRGCWAVDLVMGKSWNY